MNEERNQRRWLEWVCAIANPKPINQMCKRIKCCGLRKNIKTKIDNVHRHREDEMKSETQRDTI